MIRTSSRERSQLVRYVDPEEGFHGYLAFCGDEHRLAAGGFRVQPGLTGQTVSALATAMRLKECLLGLAVDGAKAGIDYDPTSPRKREAMRRFLRFLRPHLLGRLSLGPDLGTTWGEIESLARAEGIPSVKVAVAGAQGLEEADFARRLRLLDEDVGTHTLAQRRAGHALAHAALVAARMGGAGRRPVRAAIQGFGTLARGTALSLAEQGVSLSAVADEHGCVLDPEGLDVTALLATSPCASIAGGGSARATGPPEALFDTPVDVLVLAACEDAMTPEQAWSLPARSVVVGANLGLAPPVEELLHARGVVVVPDFVAGCGGSASMDALFGPPYCPSPRQVLDHVAARIAALVGRVLDRSTKEGVTPRQAALALCASQASAPGRPYGRGAP